MEEDTHEARMQERMGERSCHLISEEHFREDYAKLTLDYRNLLNSYRNVKMDNIILSQKIHRQNIESTLDTNHHIEFEETRRLLNNKWI